MDYGTRKRPKKSNQSSGFEFNGDLQAGRDMNFFNNQNTGAVIISQNPSIAQSKEFSELFEKFKAEIQQAAPPDKQEQVEETVQDLHNEMSKGQAANAGRLNKIIDGLVDMVPGALGAAVAMFTNPLLGTLVGQVTEKVQAHLQNK
jgi:hypothetical protein